MNNKIPFSVMLLICSIFSFTNSFSQNEPSEVLQIRMVGDSLDKIHFDLDGNNLLINGQKPEDLGIRIEIIRYKEGDENAPKSTSSTVTKETHAADDTPSRLLAKPFLGITTREESEGLLVIALHANSAAKRSGIRVGDVIHHIDGHLVRTHNALIDVLNEKVPGDPIHITYSRRNVDNDVRFRVDDESIKNDLKNNRRERPNGANNNNGKDQHDADGRTGNQNIGLVLRESSVNENLRVIEVKMDSRADIAGVKVNDSILSINGKKVKTVDDAALIMKNLGKNDALKLKVRRAGKEMTINL